jgi:FtsZ-binding cell division protein ZapB
MQEVIDPLELGQLRIKSEELEKHNKTLKKELENASQREQDLKSMHNNYMMQMQTLINQKAIEAPGAKKPWWRFW